MKHATKLEAIINERRKDLSSYAQIPTAKDSYIQKENSLIESLTEIFNDIKPMKYQNLWQRCEENLMDCSVRDANFSGILFEIRFKPKGELSFQPFNLFDDEI